MSCRSIQSRILFKRRVLRRLNAFRPDIIFLSAGFDGHVKDPIGGEVVGWTEDDFYWLTLQVQRVAQRHCNGRCVSVLEGGYNVRGGVISPLAVCVREHVRALVKASHMHIEKSESEELAAWGGDFQSEDSEALTNWKGDERGPSEEGTEKDNLPGTVAERLFGTCSSSEDSSADFSSAEEEAVEFEDHSHREDEEELPFGEEAAPVPAIVSDSLSDPSNSFAPTFGLPHSQEKALGIEQCCAPESLGESIQSPSSWMAGAAEVQGMHAVDNAEQSPSACSSLSEPSAGLVGTAETGGPACVSSDVEDELEEEAPCREKPTFTSDALSFTEDDASYCGKARRLQQLCGMFK